MNEDQAGSFCHLEHPFSRDSSGSSCRLDYPGPISVVASVVGVVMGMTILSLRLPSIQWRRVEEMSWQV